MTAKTPAPGPTVWDRLAELPEERRRFFLGSAPNTAKMTAKGPLGAIYRQISIIAPDGGLVWRPGPGWADN